MDKLLYFEPTVSELKTIKGIIYVIVNIVDNKKYIGQALKSFYERYSSSQNWWKYVSNIHLKRAIFKYGINKFRIYFLANGVEDRKRLDLLEIEFIQKFNTISPNGYNFLNGGGARLHHEETRNKISKALHPDTFHLKDIYNNKIYEIRNLTKFCKEHSLNRADIIRILKSPNRLRYRNFCRPETEIMSIFLKTPKGDTYKLFDGDIRPFCRKFKLSRTSIRTMRKNPNTIYSDWSVTANCDGEFKIFDWRDNKEFFLK